MTIDGGPSAQSDLYQFHLRLHARRAESASQASGGSSSDGRSSEEGTPFEVTFEAASEALALLPRMFVEPDGALVWVGQGSSGAWQVDGVLYDRNERLLFVELKGQCPPTAFDELLSALGWPNQALTFEMVRTGERVDEETFRRVARHTHT